MAEQKPNEAAAKPPESMSEIATEIAKENKGGEGEQPKEEKKPEEGKPEVEKPKEEPPKVETPPEETLVEGEEKPKEEGRKQKYMPVTAHMKEKRDWETEKADLTTKLEEATKGKGPETPKAELADLETEVKAIADEFGSDPDFALKLAKAVVKATQSGQQIPQEVINRIMKLEELQTDKLEDASFAEEFRKDVEPLLVTEGIPQDRFAKIKEVMGVLAFTPDYAKLPLKEIWRLSQFDDLRKKGTKSGESSNAGLRGGETGEEKSVDEMTDDEFDKWWGANVKKEKGKNTVITREGKPIKK